MQNDPDSQMLSSEEAKGIKRVYNDYLRSDVGADVPVMAFACRL